MHDAHPRLLQHLVRGKERLVGIYEEEVGRGENQQLGGRQPRGDRETQRRVRYLLPGDDGGQGDQVPTHVPLHLSAEMVVYAGRCNE